MSGQLEHETAFPGARRILRDQFATSGFTMIRVVIGGSSCSTHGWGKAVDRRRPVIAAYFGEARTSSRRHLVAYSMMFLETVGAVCIVLGLFTRVFRRGARHRNGCHRLSSCMLASGFAYRQERL